MFLPRVEVSFYNLFEEKQIHLITNYTWKFIILDKDVDAYNVMDKELISYLTCWCRQKYWEVDLYFMKILMLMDIYEKSYKNGEFKYVV